MMSTDVGIIRLLRLGSIALWLTVVVAVSLVADAVLAEGAALVLQFEAGLIESLY